MSVKELLGNLGRGMRITVEGCDLVLKIDSFFSITKNEDKIRGSVKAIVWSEKKFSYASFMTSFYKKNGGGRISCVCG